MKPRYEKILNEHDELTKKLANTTNPNELKELGKKQAVLSLTVEKIKELKNTEKETEENKKLLEDDNDEIKNLAQKELEKLQATTYKLQTEIDDALIPHDPWDKKGKTLEIRGAAGGDESSLFAAELFRPRDHGGSA